MKSKIKNLFNKLNPMKVFQYCSSLVLLGTASLNAYALPAPASNLDGVAANIEDFVKTAITAVEWIAVIAGLVMLITGVMALKQGSQDMQGTGQHGKKGITHIALGAVLVSAPIVLNLIQASLLGTNPSANCATGLVC